MFKVTEVHLRLFDGTSLVSDERVAAGLDAWERARAWKTALKQAHEIRDPEA